MSFVTLVLGRVKILKSRFAVLALRADGEANNNKGANRNNVGKDEEEPAVLSSEEGDALGRETLLPVERMRS